MVRYENCVKIHKGCGGTVKWVESIRDLSVGFYGKCTKCEREGIVVEDIIPLDMEYLDEPEVVIEKSFGAGKDNDKFENLVWDEDASWEENQERLADQVEKEMYA